MHLQHSLHKPFFYYSKTGKNKNSQLDSWHKWDNGLHSCSKWWSWMEMSEGKKLRCVYLRWYGDELSEVDWWDLPELANLQRSRKSQIQKLDVQHLTAMKGNDLHTDETHIHKTNWTNLIFTWAAQYWKKPYNVVFRFSETYCDIKTQEWWLDDLKTWIALFGKSDFVGEYICI